MHRTVLSHALYVATGLILVQLTACVAGESTTAESNNGAGASDATGSNVSAGQTSSAGHASSVSGAGTTTTGTASGMGGATAGTTTGVSTSVTTAAGPTTTTAAGPTTTTTAAGPTTTTTAAGPTTTTTGAGPTTTTDGVTTSTAAAGPTTASSTAATTTTTASSGAGGGMARACPAGADVISDFEEDAAVVEPMFGNSVGQWYTYADTTTGTTLVVESKNPSAMCDKYDLHATATGHTMYVGFGATLKPNPADPMNAAGKSTESFAAYTGVQFDIKSNGTTGPIWFEFLNTENQPAASSGTATNMSVDEYNTRGRLINPVPNTWTTVTVPFGTMGPRYLPAPGGTTGCPATAKCEAPAFNPASVLGFQFSMVNQFTPDPGSYDISVDNIQVVTGNAGLPAAPNTSSPAHPFPQDAAVGTCTKPTGASGKFLVDAYNKWKARFVVGTGNSTRVQRPENGNDTVSEGIGYGMLIAANMGDKTLFDGLWGYWQAHTTNGLLGVWNNTGGAGSATDADEDAAYALLIASKQWGGTYLASAKSMIGNIWTSDIDSTSTFAVNAGSNYPGNGKPGSTLTNPSYFAPAYYRVFATVDTGHAWMSVVNTTATYLANILKYTSSGLVPAWCSNSCTTAGTNGAATDGDYQYDSHRTPWRIGLDVCWNGASKAYVTANSGFFGGKANATGLDSLVDIYTPAGATADTTYNSMSLIGAMGVGAMAAGNTALAERAYQFVLDATYSPDPAGQPKAYTYFNATVGLVTAMTMSGNFMAYP